MTMMCIESGGADGGGGGLVWVKIDLPYEK